MKQERRKPRLGETVYFEHLTGSIFTAVGKLPPNGTIPYCEPFQVPQSLIDNWGTFGHKVVLEEELKSKNT